MRQPREPVRFEDVRMHNIELITTLTTALTAALLCGYITHRAGLSPIVGYLLAGIAVGPLHARLRGRPAIGRATGRNRRDPADVRRGTAVSPERAAGRAAHRHARRRPAKPGGHGAGRAGRALVGWDWSAGIMFGLAISVASTVVLLRVLADNRDLHTPAGHIAVGWLVVEDLFTVLVLVLLPALFGGERVAAPLALALGLRC